MSRLVLKFGGASVANVDLIRRVAGIVAGYVDGGHEVVVVVSAMRGTTDRLVRDIRMAGGGVIASAYEYSAVVAAGEQIAAGLLAAALNAAGVKSRSFGGWQVPIVTAVNCPAESPYESMDARMILSCVQDGVVPVVSGFQGVDENNRITTLGRGGSDLTAVIVANAVGADMCYIYGDVAGIYAADPKIVHNAMRFDWLNYSTMLRLSVVGVRALQSKAVEFAAQHSVKLKILSSFRDGSGTLVCGDRPDQHSSAAKGLYGIVVNESVYILKCCDLSEGDIVLLRDSMACIQKHTSLKDGSSIFVVSFGSRDLTALNHHMVGSVLSRANNKFSSVSLVCGSVDINWLFDEVKKFVGLNGAIVVMKDDFCLRVIVDSECAVALACGLYSKYRFLFNVCQVEHEGDVV